jgi:hypothetical protein
MAENERDSLNNHLTETRRTYTELEATWREKWIAVEKIQSEKDEEVNTYCAQTYLDIFEQEQLQRA